MAIDQKAVENLRIKLTLSEPVAQSGGWIVPSVATLTWGKGSAIPRGSYTVRFQLGLQDVGRAESNTETGEAAYPFAITQGGTYHFRAVIDGLAADASQVKAVGAREKPAFPVVHTIHFEPDTASDGMRKLTVWGTTGTGKDHAENQQPVAGARFKVEDMLSHTTLLDPGDDAEQADRYFHVITYPVPEERMVLKISCPGSGAKYRLWTEYPQKSGPEGPGEVDSDA